MTEKMPTPEEFNQQEIDSNLQRIGMAEEAPDIEGSLAEQIKGQEGTLAMNTGELSKNLQTELPQEIQETRRASLDKLLDQYQKMRTKIGLYGLSGTALGVGMALGGGIMQSQAGEAMRNAFESGNLESLMRKAQTGEILTESGLVVALASLGVMGLASWYNKRKLSGK